MATEKTLADSIERCSSIATQLATHKLLDDLSPSPAAYVTAFNALIAPRRGWLADCGDAIVLTLGKLAFERYQQSRSALLAEYADLAAELESRVAFQWEPTIVYDTQASVEVKA